MRAGSIMCGLVANREENDEEELLCMFGNMVSVDVVSAFLDYSLATGTDDIVGGRIMKL